MSTLSGITLTALLVFFGTWLILLFVSLVFSVIALRFGRKHSEMESSGLANLDKAIQACRDTGQQGWELVEYAQHLVARHMKAYGFFNSFDTPSRAFRRRAGYCWQRASALEYVLTRLGFQVAKVHTFINRFPAQFSDGRRPRVSYSGHVWLRVTLGNETKDVCPGDEANTPGTIHFRPITPVMHWGFTIFLLTYLGVPIVNMFSAVSHLISRPER